MSVERISRIEAVFQIGGRFLLEEESHVVQTAELSRVRWPQGAVSVRFDVVVTKITEVDGERFEKCEREQGATFWRGERRTLDDVVAAQGAESILATNMRANGWPAVVKTWAGTFNLGANDQVVAP